MIRKKTACLKRKSKTGLLYYVPNKKKNKKQLSYSGLCLHLPGQIVKRSLKSKERKNSAKKKKYKKPASLRLHSVCIWPRFRYFAIRVYFLR